MMDTYKPNCKLSKTIKIIDIKGGKKWKFNAWH
jgi:hypothetical protein